MVLYPSGDMQTGALTPARSLFMRGSAFVTVRRLNAVLASLILVLAAVSVWSIGRWRARLAGAQFSVPVSDPARAPGTPADMIEAVPYAVFKTAVEARDIFRIAGTRGGIPDVVSSAVADAAKNLRLAGIAWSEDPETMIEDISAQKTFVVRKGQQVKDFVVEEIRRDKVVLRLGQELVELR